VCGRKGDGGLLKMKILIGKTLHTYGESPFILDIDRQQFRHAWLLGKSGTGKSTLLKTIAIGIVRAGFGLAIIDPHGDLVHDVLNSVPAKRLKDISYIDPESERAPDIGLFDNPDKERATQTLMSILEAKAGTGWGPETAHILRAATDAVLELLPNPSILEIYKILVRPQYAERLLQKSKNPLVQDFYQQYFKDLKPLERARNFSHPLNKIEELMRPGIREFICQKKPMNFQRILDKQKILLCRIPKGTMGDRPAKVLGSLILSKLNLTSFRRRKRSRPFFIIVDEIHNFIGGIDFETMLAESRKYGIHYIFATQTLQQMREAGQHNEGIAFGNCSHIFSLRVSADDAEQIAKNFGDESTAPELTMLPNYTFKALTMNDGLPVASNPVALTNNPKPSGDEVPARKAMAWAKDNTGTPKDQIQKQIMKALQN
jgi:DNA helicase HerA-like ATPase